MANTSQKIGFLAPWRNMLLWKQIVIALVLGVITGVLLNATGNQAIAGMIKNIGTLFLSLIKMLIVPLIFVSLVCGMTSVSDMARMGRIGLKAIVFYLVTTAFAITIGLALGLLMQPGAGIDLSAAAAMEPKTSPPFIQQLIGIVPKNPVAAAADGNVLQIIFFAIMFGLAINLVGDAGKPVREFFEALNSVVLKLTEIVISFAPYGVFALMAWVAGTYGLDLLLPLGTVIAALYIGCILHALFVYGGLVSVFARLSPVRFFQGIIEPQIVAFTSTSSSGTLPVTMTAVQQNLGVNRSVASFTLPLGATINMDGTAMYQGVAALFVAQAFGIELGMSEYVTIILTSTLASIGTAGVPGAGLVMLSLVLTSVGLPLEGVAIIAGIDRILDMARTSLNVTGDAACTVLIAKSEDQIDLEAYDTPHVLKTPDVSRA
ncbi:MULTISPECIES: dicarboxylate/amino acid:cation symporter [Phaeobacter]|uniref:dicarboxylate/amino acid:cation symporter n=1 Tax=Phaeobacter TaxID=302485 RepID=UPI000C9C0A33|nr:MULTISPECIES: dicarboxylate/amino acid:cation symporter [Phaeobacter]AUQ56320.1 Glutamate-aspartate carrier protein [Phaeobacter inhibens]AUQ80336.1 Glutamate-aspartate carrier protein [Phaeobacter inhibens]AUR17495.1 Glutamate-aspartate carrier protein [Phaeobacter inhibens]AUR37743.1 Glutamate-aspartate carrier protein [Phaeobacter piscinae]